MVIRGRISSLNVNIGNNEPCDIIKEQLYGHRITLACQTFWDFLTWYDSSYDVLLDVPSVTMTDNFLPFLSNHTQEHE